MSRLQFLNLPVRGWHVPVLRNMKGSVLPRERESTCLIISCYPQLYIKLWSELITVVSLLHQKKGKMMSHAQDIVNPTEVSSSTNINSRRLCLVYFACCICWSTSLVSGGQWTRMEEKCDWQPGWYHQHGDGIRESCGLYFSSASRREQLILSPALIIRAAGVIRAAGLLRQL